VEWLKVKALSSSPNTANKKKRKEKKKKKNDDTRSLVAPWMRLEDTVSSEISQTQKGKYHMLSPCGT
jgi:hypothetical protein